jgi:DNA polymerase I-like protein with 3'-5' exonuclease and polymerase domains
MQITFGSSTYTCKVWHPDDGNIGPYFAYDTETTLIQGHEIPRFILGTAFNGTKGYFIQAKRLLEFWESNQTSMAYMHNAEFDMSVTELECGFTFYTMIEANKIRDSSILERLYLLATEGVVPHSGYKLSDLARRYLNVELDKNQDVRTGFDQFITPNGDIDYRAIPVNYREYAMRDSIATYFVTQILIDKVIAVADRYGKHYKIALLSHNIQLRGAVGLAAMTRLGMRIDQEYANNHLAKLRPELVKTRSIVNEAGYVQGKGGNEKAFEKIMTKFEQEYGFKLPLTETGKKSKKEEDLEPFAYIPFIDAFNKVKTLHKRITEIEKLSQYSVIHPKFCLILTTGRTSSSEPNTQNWERDGKMRGLLIPRIGYKLLSVDYTAIELCTLAQITYSLYGHSKMRDLINDGVDLHYWFAAQILGKSEADVTKEERQMAKACNFGFPGGMGIDTFVTNAKNSFEIDLTPERAKELRQAWLDNFPEMVAFLTDTSFETMTEMHDFTDCPGKQGRADQRIAAGIFIRIMGGHAETSRGRPFKETEIDWAWRKLQAMRIAGIDQLAKDVAARRGSWELRKLVLESNNVAITRTGRIRARVDYCNQRNTQFQGLAADGAKLALYRLVKEGYRVINFVHDEFLLEIIDPENDPKDVKKIMIEEMQRVCPAVTIKCESRVMDRWGK